MDIVNITLNPVEATVSLNTAPIVTTISVTLSTTEIALNYQAARDAYQLAVADGFVGTRAEWLASLQGEDGLIGSNAEIVLCANLAAYLALDPEVQMDGRWYVVPK